MLFLLFLPEIQADTAKLPIKLVDKLILIEGTVNGRVGYFILDLGVSDVVLNSAHFDGSESPGKGAFGINGALGSVETKWVKLRLGEVEWKRRLAHILPLSHLEHAKGEEILGLIGGKLFYRCELQIDLSKMEFVIKKNVPSEKTSLFDARGIEAAAILPFKLKGGMPWVEVRVNNMFFKFGLDTASEFNLMRSKLLSFVEHLLYNKRTVKSRGISGKIKSVPAGKLGGLEVGTLQCLPMGMLFTDMTIINHNMSGANLDGILGFDLLRQFKISVNYKAKEILLWPHPSSANHLIILTQKRSQDPAVSPPRYK